MLTANSSVEVVAKVNGEIIAKTYESGSNVRQGQVLFQIDPSTYHDRVQECQGTLSSAESTLEYAKAHYTAVTKALESDAVSKMEVIQAKSAFEQAQAQVRSARAELETARRDLGYCTVTAPISGTITSDLIQKGNYVTGEGAPVKLAEIYDNTVVTANFSIEDQGYLNLLKTRAGSLDFDSVPVAFDQNLPHSYVGKVTYMAPVMSESTGTLAFQADIANPYGELKPGMFVKISLPYAKADSAILIKDASISSDQLGKYVYVVNDSNKVVYSPVKVGDLYQDSLRIVTSGLKPGDRYVTKALLKVRNGETVKPRLVK